MSINRKAFYGKQRRSVNEESDDTESENRWGKRPHHDDIGIIVPPSSIHTSPEDTSKVVPPHHNTRLKKQNHGILKSHSPIRRNTRSSGLRTCDLKARGDKPIESSVKCKRWLRKESGLVKPSKSCTQSTATVISEADGNSFKKDSNANLVVSSLSKKSRFHSNKVTESSLPKESVHKTGQTLPPSKLPEDNEKSASTKFQGRRTDPVSENKENNIFDATSKFNSKLVPSEKSLPLSPPTEGFSPPNGSLNTSPPSTSSISKSPVARKLMPASPRCGARFERALQKQNQEDSLKFHSLTAQQILQLNTCKTKPPCLRSLVLKGKGVLVPSGKMICGSSLAKGSGYNSKNTPMLTTECSSSSSTCLETPDKNSPLKPIGTHLVDYSPSSGSTVSSRHITPMKPNDEQLCKNNSLILPLTTRQLNFDHEKAAHSHSAFRGKQQDAITKEISSAERISNLKPQAIFVRNPPPVSCKILPEISRKEKLALKPGASHVSLQGGWNNKEPHLEVPKAAFFKGAQTKLFPFRDRETPSTSKETPFEKSRDMGGRTLSQKATSSSVERGVLDVQRSRRVLPAKNYCIKGDSSDSGDFGSGSSDNFSPSRAKTKDQFNVTSDSDDSSTKETGKPVPQHRKSNFFMLHSGSESVSSSSSNSGSDSEKESDSDKGPDSEKESASNGEAGPESDGDNFFEDNIPDHLLEDQVNNDTNNVTKKTSVALKEERKIARNTGKSYLSSKGKIVPERTPKPLTCKHRGKTFECATILTPENIDTLHNEYWNLQSYNKRVQYVAARMESSRCERIRIKGVNRQKARNVANKYFVEVDGVRHRICKSAFEKVFGESDTFTRNVSQKKKKTRSGFPADDGRGRHKSKHILTEEQTSAMISHINSYPAYVSHYCRKQTQQKYLASNLTVACMYREYKKKNFPKVSYSSFRRTFKKMKLKFKPPHSDTCARCDELEILIKAGGQFKEEYERKKEFHLRKSERAYALKRETKAAAENDPCKRVLIFDLQQCLPTPDLKTGKVYYLRQLYTYNLTVYDSKTNITHCYMWHEGESARGANEIASCLFKHIMDEVPTSVTHLSLFSDCCSGQNRNSIVASMLLLALEQHKSLQCIDHIFLVPGHTRMECDNKHAVIENFKKRCENKMSLPSDWYKLVEEAGNESFVVVEIKDDLYDFKILLGPNMPLIKRMKLMDGQDFKWTKTCWFQYLKQDKYKVHVRNSYSEVAPFNSLNMLRRGQKSPQLAPLVKKLPGVHPISDKKKVDLLSLLVFIDHEYRQFYQDLITGSTLPDVDPELPEANGELDDFEDYCDTDE